MKSKTIKILPLTICLSFFLTLSVLFIIYTGAYRLLFVNQVSYEYTDSNKRVAVFGDPGWLTAGELDKRGYAVRHPRFEGSSSLNYEKFGWIYSVLASPGVVYATEIIHEYRNCAVLDFEVETVKNETLTISFYGYGYPDLGEGEPVSLDRVFIFDISSVSADNPPVLIIVDGETVTDENRWTFYYSWLDEKPEDSMV